jgi:transposase
MLTERKEVERNVMEIMCTELLVPKEHLLRKIDAAVDFTHIYDIVSELYCKDNGRPSVDPVVLFKMVLIQHLYGIPSLRQTVAEIDMNIAYRWFLGYKVSEAVPHFATVSYNFRHRFSSETIESIFQWILYEIERAGYLTPEVVYIDATHIKANANVHKKIKREIPKAARQYEKALREEINGDREAHGKKPFDADPPAGGTRVITGSKTDPESGLFHKGEHKMCFAYGAHTVCEDNNYVLGVEVRPGNQHDSVVFDDIYRKVKERFPQIEVVTADAGYKTPWICKQVFDDGKLPSLPYRAPMTKKGNHPWYEYVYDEYMDIVICPEYQTLRYATTNKDGYREYKSKPYICVNCPTRTKCTQSRNCQKTVTVHVWQEYLERAEDVRHSPIGKSSYARRKETIERVFADAKEKHGMRYTQYRGLSAVTNWVKLKYTAMNLKKFAIHRWKERFPSPPSFFARYLFCFLFTKNPLCV